MRLTSIISLLLAALPLFCADPKEPASNPKWAISADFLAWLASEEEASIWIDATKTEGLTTTEQLPSFNFNWDYGFRIGAGYDLERDCWDTVLYWSWFRTDAKHSIPYRPGQSITPEFQAAFLAGIDETILTAPQSVSATWNLLFNMFDWELGRKFWISHDISVRPFFGIKGGWINQSIYLNYYDLTLDLFFPSTNSGKEHVKNNFWGVGPLGGVDTKWRAVQFASHSFDFFGDFSLATMWGDWSCSDQFRNTLSYSFSINTDNAPLGALMFRSLFGLGWEADSSGGKAHFAAKLGFETQLWLNQLRIATFQLQRLHHDLTLQGITFNARVDF